MRSLKCVRFILKKYLFILHLQKLKTILDKKKLCIKNSQILTTTWSVTVMARKHMHNIMDRLLANA